MFSNGLGQGLASRATCYLPMKPKGQVLCLLPVTLRFGSVSLTGHRYWDDPRARFAGWRRPRHRQGAV